MTQVLCNVFHRTVFKQLEEKLRGLTITNNEIIRNKYALARPKLRNPIWLTKKHRSLEPNFLTSENKEFIKEVVTDKYSVIKPETPINTNIEWTDKMKRTGLIGRKIGIYPLWLKNGKKIQTTLIQILDNHVVKYIPPEEYNPPRQRVEKIYNKKGCLLIGAEAADPSIFTKEYCGIFKHSGVIPKRILGRFFVSPDAVLPPGTLLNALHFPVGHYVDVRGKTIDRGFQGVMKRHGFKGMPASHGVTKTHRRGGCVGGGGAKGRIWPGTKMPGHMGNRYRVAKGLKIWRINTKYNVLYVSGQAIPGGTNDVVYIYDSILPTRKPAGPLPFPTYLMNDEVAEDIYDKEIHLFEEPSVMFKETE
ncbi:39S ribosomal protein L3, mitochondrial [Harmonia axyridis]|uniref:39S ribosomal protein L3, mitochondrial n=1 Tax=Harmonia axyridis TaxID=115357 RepID=UPI001E27936D|nr:39S ribosomal protein L3, mitochondrial [Harmonia axyridis]